MVVSAMGVDPNGEVRITGAVGLAIGITMLATGISAPRGGGVIDPLAALRAE